MFFAQIRKVFYSMRINAKGIVRQIAVTAMLLIVVAPTVLADETATTGQEDASLAQSQSQPAEQDQTWLADVLKKVNLSDNPTVEMVAAIAIVILLSLVAYAVIRWCVRVIVNRLVKRSRTTWDETLRDMGFFSRLVPIVPTSIVYWSVILVPHLPESVTVLVQRLSLGAMILLIARALSTLLAGVNVIYQKYPVSRNHPIKGYVQVIKVVMYVFAAILIFAVLMDQSPWFFISGMGAMMAIFMLVFRDTLLSFVAGIQLVNNGVIHVGDWIEMPQFNADGDVIDIALNVVTVQNWDKTITVIPTHKFLEHSFKNWRTMFEAGGRRIMRSINIDMSSIRFLSDTQIERFSRFLLLEDYMKRKIQELEEHNAKYCPDEFSDIMTNSRRLTNVGTFRAYVIEYLRQHPQINQDLTFLVRQLQPTAQGLPIQIYVFVSETAWAVYEGVQADIFDHLLAAVPEFGLRVYQEPSGHDLSRIGNSSPVKMTSSTTAKSVKADSLTS